MRILLLPVLAVIVLSAGAQTEPPPVRVFERYQPVTQPAPADTPATDTTSRASRMGEVTITADPRIDRLMELHAEHKHLLPGYRVQIFLGDRRTAEDTKRAFMQKYPDLAVYMSWLAPNFRLRVGDLRTRLEAERLLRDLKVAYPGSYIVPDEVELPKISTPQ
jgi:hypothetical protein